ncbi:MAG: amidohydrolase family protein [Candidatus Sericytochromatia bacterium]
MISKINLFKIFKLMNILLIISTFFALKVHAHPIIPAEKQKERIALTGATIHTITKGDIEGATIIFENGKITFIGKINEIDKQTKVIDVTGKHIYPSMLASLSSMGLSEIDAVRATNDDTEVGEINPNVKAEIAFNPDSEVIPVTRANGVLLALSIPSGGLISGTSSLMMLDGWTKEDMTLKSGVGIHINFPSMRVNYSAEKAVEEQKEEISKRIDKLTDFFEKAKIYYKAKNSKNNNEKPSFTNLKYEAVIPVLEKKTPVFIYADDIQQIQTAISWADKLDLKMVLVGGYDSWRVSKLLVEKNIPVIISSTLKTPAREWEAYDEPFTLAKKLYEAGVKYCIGTSASAFGTSNARNLPYNSAMAVSFGLPMDEGIKAITLYPAQILGVDNSVGSLEVGKDATLIVTNGNPLEIPTNTELAFIQGKNIDLNNKHKTLYEKYKKKYN